MQFHSDHIKVQYATYPAIGMKQLIPKLTEEISRHPRVLSFDVPKFTAPIPDEAGDIISHAWFWPRMGKFFRPKDVVVAETGMTLLFYEFLSLRDLFA